MKSLYGILTIILNCCNISYSAIQKDCLLETPFPDYTSIFLFLFPIVTSSDGEKFVITHSLVHSPKEQKNSLKRLKRLQLISMLTLKSLQAFLMPNNFG